MVVAEEARDAVGDALDLRGEEQHHEYQERGREARHGEGSVNYETPLRD